MPTSSSSSSSSSDDEKSAPKPRKDQASSGSDFETRESKQGISPQKVSTPSTIIPVSKTTTTNVNVLSAMAKGNSKDFMTKMNAAMQRNVPPKSLLPQQKLKRIGFDNDQSNSSDNKQSPTKKATNTLSSKKSSDSSSDSSSSDKDSKIVNTVKASPVTKTLQSNKKDSSNSDSDSGNESRAKQKALLLKNRLTKKKSSEDSDSDSSNSVKNQAKVVKQVSFSKPQTVFDLNKKSEVQVQNKSSVSSDSDSDSEDESNSKRIEEIKKELMKLQTSRKRQKSTSNDSDSSSDEDKTRQSKLISSTKIIKADQVKTDSDSDDSDNKMTSILTQRETPTKPAKKVSSNSSSTSSSGSNSDSDASRKETKTGSSNINKHKSGSDSDVEDESLIARDKFVAHFITDNSDYREIKIKSTFDPETLTKDDELYSCNLPKHLLPELLLNKEFSLDKLSTLSIGRENYNIKIHKDKKIQSLCFINRRKSTTLVNLNLSGQIKVYKTPDKVVQIGKQVNLTELTNDRKVVTPELKKRHPIFGADLSKVILNESVQNKLDSMIEDLNKKISKSKKKKSKLVKEEDSVLVMKEDIYKMLNFLQDASVDENIIDKNKPERTEKSKKKSTKNHESVKEQQYVFTEPPPKKSKTRNSDDVPPIKSKKSKLKLLPRTEENIESISDDVNIQKPEKSSKKSKKKSVDVANSTFVGPSIDFNVKLLDDTESTSNHSKPSKRLKHLEKIIKKVAKDQVGDDSLTSSGIEVVNDLTKELQDTEIVAKKKKKKNKNKNKSKDS